jgi:hypothetical protein
MVVSKPITNNAKSLIMKRLFIIPVILAVLVTSCNKDNPWLDHDNPQVYLPKSGVTFNTAWMIAGNEYTINFGVYLSGVRPENQNADVAIGFTVSQSIVDSYNSDITQQYSGQVQALPADCYTISGTNVVIPKGDVAGSIPIKVLVDKVALLPLLNGNGDTILYVVPILLNSTSKYRLNIDETKIEALAAIRLEMPRFYFWANRNGLAALSRRLIFTDEPETENFRISSYGVPNDRDYTITIAYDPTYPIPSDGALLPSTAYELPSATVTIANGKFDTEFPVKIINNMIPTFAKSFTVTPFNSPDFYYLPLKITTASTYGGDSEKGILLLKVSAKNDYEWVYTSAMTSLNTSDGRSVNYSQNKSPTTHDGQTLRIQVLRNSSNAGTTVNNKFYLLKVIPNPADSRKWGVEIIRITNEGAQSSPTTLELHPTKESYYDWDYETFYLNYRFQVGTVWYEVSEILEAQF